MKQYTVYVCETCGYESKDIEDMKRHEATHLGLTVEEMDKYEEMKSFATFIGSAIVSKRCEETEKKLNEAVNAVFNFEKEHGIKNGFTLDYKELEEESLRQWKS